MYIKKDPVIGKIRNYVGEAFWNRDDEKLQILIYDNDPKRTIFGVPIKTKPVIEREFELIESERVDNYTRAFEYMAKLVREWELPILESQALEKWDGDVYAVQLSKKNSNKIEEKVKTEKDEIPIYDWLERKAN